MAAVAAACSRIVYEVWCDGFKVFIAHDRDEAEDARDAHANRNGNDPLSERYEILPIFSEGAQS